MNKAQLIRLAKLLTCDALSLVVTIASAPGLPASKALSDILTSAQCRVFALVLSLIGAAVTYGVASTPDLGPLAWWQVILIWLGITAVGSLLLLMAGMILYLIGLVFLLIYDEAAEHIKKRIALAKSDSPLPSCKD
jgi:hypothetical protein